MSVTGADAGRGLKRILFATDFSPRSDRAGRRAALLARQMGAGIVIVHVVDDDRPPRLVQRARAEALDLLEEMRRTFAETDGIDCDVTVALGEAFAGTLAAASDTGADVIVIGPHRRRILKDVFIGTTAERTVRGAGRPVLMANGTPAGPYRNVLVATDLSDCSSAALRLCDRWGLGETASVSLVHVFDAPARGLMRSASVTQDAIADYVSEETERAESELRAFLARHAFGADRILLRPAAGPVAAEILKAAGECDAHLIVVGTHGRTGIAKALLGSVTEYLLRTAECDVLAVPSEDG
jgi:nucleotide-binding universal stress UspA family protein